MFLSETKEISKIWSAKIAQSTPKCGNGHGELPPFVTGFVTNCKVFHIYISYIYITVIM